MLAAAQHASHDTAERVFILVDVALASPHISVIYQFDGNLIDGSDEALGDVSAQIRDHLQPQAQQVAGYLSDLYRKANLEVPLMGELQLEKATMAWFSHSIYDSDLSHSETLSGWRKVLEDAQGEYSLDSDRVLPWFPVPGNSES
jgi:hypothetical protein